MIIKETDFGLPPDQMFSALHERDHSFFFDSSLSVGGLGAWSFIGFDPFLIFRAKGDVISLLRDGEKESFRGEPLEELGKILHRYHRPGDPRLPFSGGAVGYLSYEAGLRFERIAPASPDDLGLADIEFGFYDGLLAFDHTSRRAYIVANPVSGAEAGIVVERLEKILRESTVGQQPGPAANSACPEPRSNFTKDEYLRAVARIKDYIAAGDVYQVNLTQRFETPLACHPYELYQRLRRRSPSPFGSYLNFGAMQAVSSSPERFLCVRHGRVETRPIKGTRPRGLTPAEDTLRREELLASEKDRAELLMIVDLERNDLGRVCVPGSIAVDELYRLETHPTVHHLVAGISGRLRADADVFDCIRAAFPGGSITGAPKIRTMQVINEIETRRRHLYTGSIGYLGYDGSCDLNIAIRTISCVHGRACYHVGGGVVWDSDPEAEYQETLDKGRAMRASLMNESVPPLP